jgi:phosphatidylglycerol:prolipoprotein diacylglycerol transferase
MLEFYQNLPNQINPVIFSAGFISLHWYSLMWLMALGVTYFLLIWRIKKGEGSFDKSFIQDLLLNSFLGALIGGRLGYVLFYNFNYFLQHPLAIVSPYNFETGVWTGIYGMSFHGGLIGVFLAILFTARKYQHNFLAVADFILPAFCLGYFFGRLGNFFNSELVGRITESFWGMYFNGEAILRHPSQLYEAVGEGLLLFIIFWFLRNKNFASGMLTGFYLMAYALMRFMIEFFRQPDEHLGFIFLNLSMGQILSSLMFLIGFWLVWRVKKQKRK